MSRALWSSVPIINFHCLLDNSFSFPLQFRIASAEKMLTLIIISHIQKKITLQSIYTQLHSRWKAEVEIMLVPHNPAVSVSGFPSNSSKGWSRDGGVPLWDPVSLAPLLSSESSLEIWLKEVSPVASAQPQKFRSQLAQC